MHDKNVKQFACGILYNHSFKLLDNWGAIADCILYNNSYFSPQYFPSITSQYTTSGVLSNNDEGHSIQLTSSNLIYTHVVQNDFEQEYEIFKKRILKFLIPRIIEDNGLIVRRIGVIFTCEMDDLSIQKFASKYFRPEFHGVTDFRFSKKESTISGAVFSDKSDFINKIYTVGAIGAGPVGKPLSGICFDYQAHYVPPRSDISKQAESILDTSRKLLDQEILTVGDKK